jgi:hypothetical protein
MATTEEQLLKQLAELEENEARIDEPIMTGPVAPTEGMPPEGALGMRADIAAGQQPGDVEALLEVTGSPAAGAGPILPERGMNRVNPFAPDPEDRARKNPFAPRGAKEEPDVDFPTDFPMEPGTSRASLQLPELFSQIGAKHFFPEDYPKWAQAAMTASMMTTTDPAEIAQMFTQEVEYQDPNTGEMKSSQMFPNIGLQQAPDGTLILNNTKTGAQAIINRPGISSFDAMQMGVIGAAYTPVGRYATVASAPARAAAVKAAKDVGSETARRLAIRQARKASARAMMAGSAVTEAGLQAGQQVAGGEFNTADVAMSTAFGVVPDYVFDPLARTMTKIPSYLADKTKDVVPANVRQAINYAKETGKRIMTTDAVAERMTPAKMIFKAIVERIPIAGTGAQRREMARQRNDALTELAAKYGIDVETDYGTKVMESFVDRMMKQRFWGQQQDLLEKIPFFPKGARARAQQRADDMIENAWVKEMDEISEGVLKEAIANDQLDDIVVDKVMDSARPKLLQDLFGKLTAEGQDVARKRFILRGLEDATWTPEAPSVADPAKFMAFLDKPSSRKVIAEWFTPEDQEMVKGIREYLRITASAQSAGKGAGMVAAGATAGGAAGAGIIFGILDSIAGISALTGGAGRLYQNTFRNFFLRMAHTEGDEAATAAIMQEMRPLIQAGMNQWKQDNYHFPEVNITADSLKEGGEDLLMNLEDTAKGVVGDIGQLPDKLVKFMTGEK